MQIKWVGSPNFGYPRGTHGQNRPEALFWHITASNPTDPPLDGLDGWFQNPKAGSTQFGIQDKECHQYVKIEDACWGQGYMDDPDLSNPNVFRWWNNTINPNLRSIGIEVVMKPGLVEVPRGTHLVNNDTWNTMKELGLYIAEEVPRIDLVVVNWLGHWQVDGVNRQRDPKNVYWPVDILEEILEDVMAPVTHKMMQDPSGFWLVQRVPLKDGRQHPVWKEKKTQPAIGALIEMYGLEKVGEPGNLKQGQFNSIPTIN